MRARAVEQATVLIPDNGESNMKEMNMEEKWSLLEKKELFYCTLGKEYLNAETNGTEIAGVDCDSGIVEAGAVPLLINVNNITAILESERKSDPYAGQLEQKTDGIYMLPFYLYFDEEKFVKFLQHNDISELCRYRIVIIVGLEEFESFFCQFDVIHPTVLLGERKEFFLDQLEKISSEKRKIYGELFSTVSCYYRENGKEIKQRILDGSARICILKNYFEPPRFKSLYAQLKKSLEKIGYSVEICNEQGPVFRTNEIVNVYKLCPDIVFEIDKTRNGGFFSGEPVYLRSMDNLIFINWLQDMYPESWEAEYVKELKVNDYVFAAFDKAVLSRCGYLDENVIYKGIMPAEEDGFTEQFITKEEHERYDCDVCVCGTVMDEEIMAQYIYEGLSPYLSGEQIDKFCDMLMEILNNIYDPVTQKYKTDLNRIYDYTERLKNDFQCSAEARLAIFRMFIITRFNTMRKLVMKHLAEQKKYRIIYYGTKDVGIEGVDFGGYIFDRRQFSKALRCSKICMQINSDMTMNQRVLESLLSRTIVLVYKIREEDDMNNISQYLDDMEGICYFENKKDLIEKCDLLLNDHHARETIVQRGYQKVRETLMPDHIFSHMMEELKRKIQEGQEEENS